MALYASDEDRYIFAADAAPGGSYRCLECSAPVKVRRGRNRIPHFYHLHRSPRCHLYSKSEDHLILQLQIQKALSDETVQIEKPFFSIHRIADLLWEKEKIAFEIQCSFLDISEARKRVVDYGKIGYHVVWLLDDRIFNRRSVRPAEEFLRMQTCYFFSFQRSGFSYFYDQMEIIMERKRLRKGPPFKINLSKPRVKPFLEWPPDLPSQIQERTIRTDRYFQGDLIHLAIQAAIHPSIVCIFERWRKLEIELLHSNKPPGWIAAFVERFIARPYLQTLDWLIDRVNNE